VCCCPRRGGGSRAHTFGTEPCGRVGANLVTRLPTILEILLTVSAHHEYAGQQVAPCGSCASGSAPLQLGHRPGGALEAPKPRARRCSPPYGMDEERPTRRAASQCPRHGPLKPGRSAAPTGVDFRVATGSGAGRCPAGTEGAVWVQGGPPSGPGLTFPPIRPRRGGAAPSFKPGRLVQPPATWGSLVERGIRVTLFLRSGGSRP